MQAESNDDDNQSTAATGGEDDEIDRLDLEDQVDSEDPPPALIQQMDDHETQIDVDVENQQENDDPITMNLRSRSSPKRQDGEDEPDQVNAFDIEDDELIENENGELSWIDAFQIINFKNPRQYSQFLGRPHRWKGADWTLLLVYDPSRHYDRAGVFIGFQNPFHLPKGFTIKIKYWIREIDSNSNSNADPSWADSRSSDIHYSKQKNCKNSERFDSGFWDYVRFPTQEINEANARNEPYIIHVEIKIKLMFAPATVPANYNSKAVTGMVGLENLGATCYLNALLQMLFHLNIFRKMVYQMPHQDENLSSSITLALQYVFKNLQSSSTEVSTKDLTRAFGWTTQEAFMQQDIQEMLRVLVDKLEEKMKGTALDGHVKSLFAGSIRSYIKCVNVNFQSTREEDFYDVQLDIKGCSGIEASLQKYIEIETLEGENQYDAEKFGKQVARKGAIFTKFPPVLTMHLKRFDFDLTLMNFRKIHDYYEFPCLLELDNYLADDCPPEARSGPNRYILHSVLVHSGDVGGGHYYAYIRPATEKNVQNVYTLGHFDPDNSADDMRKLNADGSMEDWYKFNDDIVLPVTKREAVSFCYGRKKDDDFYRSYASAYMLVYIREHEASEIMQPLQETDIPCELQLRFDAELALQRAQQRQEARNKMMMRVGFVIEEDLAAFNNYNKFQDLIDDTRIRYLFLLRESTHAGLQLYLANLFNLHPLAFRLWVIEPSGNNPRKSSLRVSRLIAHDELGSPLVSNNKRAYFMQVLNFDVMPDSGMLSQFDEYLQAIYQRLDAWRVNVRRESNRFPDLVLNEGENDPLLIALPGMNNSMLLKELKEYDHDLDPKFDKEAITINHHIIQLLEEYIIAIEHQKASQVEEEYEKVDEDDLILDTLIFFKVFDPLNLLPSLIPQQHEDGAIPIDEQMNTSHPAYLPEMSGEPFGLENVVFYGQQYHADSALKYLGFVENPGPDSDLADFLIAAVTELFNKRYPSLQLLAPLEAEAYHLASDPNTMLPLTDSQISEMSLNEVIDEYGSPLFVVHLTLPDRAPEPHPLDNQCLMGVQQYMKFFHNKRKVTILPSCANDLKILYNIVTRFEASAAANAAAAFATAAADASSAEESQPLGDDNVAVASDGIYAGLPAPVAAPSPLGLSLFKSPVRRKLKRKRSLESVYRDGSLLRILYGIDIEISSNTKLLDVINFIGNRIGAEIDQIALCPAAPHLGKLYDQTKLTSFTSSISTYSFNEFLKRADNRLSYQKSNVVVFYKLLPVPLQGDNGEDVRIASRILDFTINDERLRRWRMAFLYQAHLQQQANQDGGLSEENEFVKARKLSSIDKLVIGSERASAVATAGGLSLEQQEFFQWVMNLSKTIDLAWPATNEPNPYNIPEIGRIVFSVHKTAWKNQTAEVLRNALGLPTNLQEVPSIQAHQVLPADHRSYDFFLNQREMFADQIEIDDTGLMKPVMPLIIGVISRQHMVRAMFDSCLDPNQLPACWPELREAATQSERLFVQTCEPQDVIFLRRAHPHIRSMIITIFNFTLIGNAVKAVDMDIYNAPIVTYVKEDDDYESLIDRISTITGEKELTKLRLAVIDPQNMTPEFIPKPNFSSSESASAIASSDSIAAQEQDMAVDAEVSMPAGEIEQAAAAGDESALDTQDTDDSIIFPQSISATKQSDPPKSSSLISAEDRESLLTKKRPPRTIYERFLVKYPHFEDANDHHSHYDWNTRANKGINKVHFPSLGIQRAAAEVQTLQERREMSINAQPGEARSRQYNTGIKIV